MVNIRPAGREDCRCSSPYNKILEQLNALASDIESAADMARNAYDVANAQAGNASQYASDARDAADDALLHAQAAQQSADDALAQATAAAGSASDAADSAADALQAVEDIQADIATIIAADIGAKVDKLTTAGFYLYSHNGSSQGEVQPVVAPTAATIPIRDSNGRMQAADPASGATDKTLVTANWVSQTGDASPNNIVHRSGNETVTGTKTITRVISDIPVAPFMLNIGDVTQTAWRKLYTWTAGTTTSNQTIVIDYISKQSTGIYGTIVIQIRSATITTEQLLGSTTRFKLTRDGSTVTLWTTGYRLFCCVKYSVRATNTGYTANGITVDDWSTDYDEPSQTTGTNIHNEVIQI